MNMILYMGMGGSLLVLGVMIFRSLFLQRIPKYLLVMLWLIVLARLLLPLAIPVSWRLPVRKLDQAAGIYRPDDGGMELPLSPRTAFSYVLAEKENPNSALRKPRLLLISIWLCGTAVTAGIILGNHWRWLKVYRMSLPLMDRHILEWQKLHKGRKNIKVRSSDQVCFPLTYGLFSPVILLPSELSQENKDRIDFILSHEWIHIRHRHIAIKYAMCLAVCMYWFNPLVWIMSSLLSRDLELSCDEEVICGYDNQRKKEYAMLLIRQAVNSSAFFPAGVCFSKSSELEERIKSIMKTNKYSKMIILPTAILVICMAATFTVAAQVKSTPKPAFAYIPASLNTAIQTGETSTDVPEDLPATSVSGSEIAKLAQNYLGAPYRYGGTDLSTDVDCTGYIKAIYEKAGISLPSRLIQLPTAGTPVSPEEIALGDVVLYGTLNEDATVSPVHAAIYIGDGQVIHASNIRDGVKISDLDYRPYYQILRLTE